MTPIIETLKDWYIKFQAKEVLPHDKYFRETAIFWTNCSTLIKYNPGLGPYWNHQLKLEKKTGIICYTSSLGSWGLENLDATVPALRKICTRIFRQGHPTVASKVSKGLIRMHQTYAIKYQGTNHPGYPELCVLAAEVKRWEVTEDPYFLVDPLITKQYLYYESLYALSRYDLAGTKDYENNQLKAVVNLNLLVNTGTYDGINQLGELTPLKRTVVVLERVCARARADQLDQEKIQELVFPGVQRVKDTYVAHWEEIDPNHPGLEKLKAIAASLLE